jgi:hypothetical protein
MSSWSSKILLGRVALPHISGQGSPGPLDLGSLVHLLLAELGQCHYAASSGEEVRDSLLPATLNDNGGVMLVEDESVAARVNGVGNFLVTAGDPDPRLLWKG